MKIGFLGALFLIFLTLKLTGYIVWSWWWVTAPLWAVPALVIGVPMIVAGFLFAMAWILEGIEETKKRR